MYETKNITQAAFFLTVDDTAIRGMSSSLFFSPFKYIPCQLVLSPFAYALLLLWNDPYFPLSINNWAFQGLTEVPISSLKTSLLPFSDLLLSFVLY